MRIVYAAAAVICIVCAGCASAPPPEETAFGAPVVAGVREDLSGLDRKSLKKLADIYIAGQKVFLYASAQTNSPIVARGDTSFAVQFRTAAVSKGFNEALAFNGFMLGYMRDQLKLGLCPEHPQARLAAEKITEKQPRMKKGRKPNAIMGGRQVPVIREFLVCPVDGRKFQPDNQGAKAKKPEVDANSVIKGLFDPGKEVVQ